MKTATRHRRSPPRQRIEPLPIQGLYSVNQLARALGCPHRRLQRLLKTEGVQVFRVVPLTELEEKVPLVWENVKPVEALRESTR